MRINAYIVLSSPRQGDESSLNYELSPNCRKALEKWTKHEVETEIIELSEGPSTCESKVGSPNQHLPTDFHVDHASVITDLSGLSGPSQLKVGVLMDIEELVAADARMSEEVKHCQEKLKL
eukprot:747999-Amphidinium_carterae.1